MLQLEQQQLLNNLKQQGYGLLPVTQWNEQVRQDLVSLLDQAGLNDYKFYKVQDEENKYIVALKYENYIPYPLEELYPKRSIVFILLPLIAVIFIALTSIWGQLNHKLIMSPIALGLPVILGALVEYFSIVKQPKAKLYKILGIQVATLIIILLFAMIILGEGIICLIMISPMILGCLFIGAILMRMFCYYLWKPSLKIYSIAILPLLFALLLPDLKQTQYGKTQRSIVIQAPAEQVFYAIQHIGKIKSQEVKDSPIFWMGFPKPIFGMTEQRGEKSIRTIQWERGIKFEEVVQASYAPHLLSWTYQFKPDSFPKGSVDDHIEMGGQYFDLLKTDYQLEKIDSQTTKLILTSDYRLSTEYNWYSKIWVHYILNEFSDVVMSIHKQRLEQKTYMMHERY